MSSSLGSRIEEYCHFPVTHIAGELNKDMQSKVDDHDCCLERCSRGEFPSLVFTCDNVLHDALFCADSRFLQGTWPPLDRHPSQRRDIVSQTQIAKFSKTIRPARRLRYRKQPSVPRKLTP